MITRTVHSKGEQMRKQIKYLNIILTIVAVLLGAWGSLEIARFLHPPIRFFLNSISLNSISLIH